MEDKYMSRREFIVSLVGLGGILSVSSQAQAGIFKGSLIDRLFISGPREKKAEKKLNEYAADGKLTDYEKEQVLRINDGKKIREQVSSTQNRLEAERREREKKAASERREREKKAEAEKSARNKTYAEEFYSYAQTSSGKGDYGRALAYIDNAIQCDPGNLKYSAYRSYLKARSGLEEFRIKRREESERRERNNRLMKRMGSGVRRVLERR